MKKYRNIVMLLGLCMIVHLGIAQQIQRYNTFSYNVNEGLLQSTMHDLAVDKNNFCWISFPNGIQKFDGKNFTNIPIQAGLPDDKFVTFFKCNNGDLLLSHANGISKYLINANRLQQVYSNPSTGQKPPKFVGQDGDIIYFFTENGEMIGLDGSNYNILSKKKIPLSSSASIINNLVKFSDNIINHRTAFLIQQQLYLWNLKTAVLEATSAINGNISVFLLHLKNESEVIYYNDNDSNSLNTYNFLNKKITQISIAGTYKKQYGRCCILPWANKTLISFDSKLYETDSALSNLKAELVNFQNNAVAGAGSIASIAPDNFGNLYLRTVTAGLKKIIRNNYPIKYYGSKKTDENFIISILPQKEKNRIIAGANGHGIFIFDTLQHLLKHIEKLPNGQVPFSPNQIVQVSNNRYIIFCPGEKNIWLANDDFSKMAPIVVTSNLPIDKRGVSYFCNTISATATELVVQSQNKIYKVNLLNFTATEHWVTDMYTMSGLRFHNNIITHCNDELIFLDAASLALRKKITFKHTGDVRCFAVDIKNQIYIGSNKGIFKIDSSGRILKQYNKESGLADECVYAIIFDKDGILWCSTNKGILKLNTDNTFVQLTKDDGLQENEFNTNVVAKAEDGELFFGGVNGVSSFYPAAISSVTNKINILFTHIKINNKEAFTDTAAWSIKEMDLPYNQNLLAFDFIASANNNPGQYIYQFKMEGLDKEWIRNDELQTARYFLPPGEYVFKISASSFFNTDAKSLKEIKIIIHPPFWETWWFYIAVALLLAGIMFYSINRLAKRKYQQKLNDLQNEQRIQRERERISRDLHDSIGAYANAVLYSTELLEQEAVEAARNVLMSDLKFASKDIITALRETIWALKKETYSREECLLRIKNFMQALARYYTHIQFKVEGNTNVVEQIDHNKALNIVRIVQEAATNAIKHAAPTNIIVQSKEVDGKWMLNVSDDGKGFEYKIMQETKPGNGLDNIQQRAKESRLKVCVNSTINKGTIVSIST